MTILIHGHGNIKVFESFRYYNKWLDVTTDPISLVNPHWQLQKISTIIYKKVMFETIFVKTK